jgi:hypothetical protein
VPGTLPDQAGPADLQIGSNPQWTAPDIWSSLNQGQVALPNALPPTIGPGVPGANAQNAYGSASASATPTRGDPRGLRNFIAQTAQKYGIDPRVALRVAESEGLRSFQSGIRGENSYGAFQLNTQGGLGNIFYRQTGLNPADPRNERATIDFALRYASQHGWGPWHGARNTGVGQWQGINRQIAAAATPNPASPDNPLQWPGQGYPIPSNPDWAPSPGSPNPPLDRLPDYAPPRSWPPQAA